MDAAIPTTDPVWRPLVGPASLKLHPSKTRSNVYRIGIVILALVLALSNIRTSWTSSFDLSSANPSNNTLRLLVHPEKKDFDFHELILNVKRDDLVDHSCPLDAFFNDACKKRAGGQVCVYHDTILKKIDPKYVDREITSIERLTDPRFFPRAYHVDERCATVVLENVRPKGMKGTSASLCSNYTYYEDFYKSAFDIFNEQNIIPEDLNVCCNTMTHL